MTTLELLRQRAPGLASMLDTSDADVLRRISSSIARAVVNRSDLTDPLIAEALQHLSSSTHPRPDLRARVQSLAKQLDAHYFDLQDMCDHGKATDVQVSGAFAKARAATAVASALNNAAAETAYEAVCGIANSEDYFTGVARSVLTR